MNQQYTKKLISLIFMGIINLVVLTGLVVLGYMTINDYNTDYNTQSTERYQVIRKDHDSQLGGLFNDYILVVEKNGKKEAIDTDQNNYYKIDKGDTVDGNGVYVK